MRKVILVEGPDDVAFIKALLPSVEVREIEIRELKGGGSSSQQELIRLRLETERNDMALRPIEKMGIMLDLDEFSSTERLELLNKSIEDVFEITLTATNTFKETIVYGSVLQIACHFINPNLDVLQRQIAAKDTELSDCMVGCMNGRESIKPKEINKAWKRYYMEWEICNFQERRKAKEHINFTYTTSKGAWNLEAPILKDLKAFLALF